MGLLEAHQYALIRNIRFLIFGLITTTFHDVLEKNKYQHDTYKSTHLGVDNWLRLSWKMLAYYNLTVTVWSQENPLSKLLLLKIFWVDNNQFPAKHKKSVRKLKFNIL